MRASSMCISCLISKQEKLIRQFPDEEKKSEYMHQVLGILYQNGQSASAPSLAEKIDTLHRQFWGQTEDFSAQKKLYNDLLLSMEEEIERRIRDSEDPLRECIKYVCAGNYIDFSAVENVDKTVLGSLLEKAAGENVPEEEYQAFLSDLRSADTLVCLTDNCGEIVLDKIFIRHLKEEFPDLKITAIVRGQNVINDATMEDAKAVGLTGLIPCIGNGNAAPGTVLSELSPEARRVLLEADVIISKGQGNFESLYGEGLNPYYLFLCKCELFVRRFGLERYASVFSREDRIFRARRGGVSLADPLPLGEAAQRTRKSAKDAL
ncbi:DUF89 family protein [Mediterraneibacter glycyrrhizinilyticus]|nr:ARMT1-like domain-containing protein [Mediterraneibacter glycyrrhizinilyticus]MBM6853942.1 DUF89 family protein [Mediterraneibacter glycyrrhizinilyticus]